MNPRELDQKGEKALVFEVAWALAGTDSRLVTEKGWRVWRGTVTPPATRGKGGRYFPTIVVENEGLAKALELQVALWEPLWPQVQFPGRES